MTREARMMSGIMLITVPTIQYGGYFPADLTDEQGQARCQGCPQKKLCTPARFRKLVCLDRHGKSQLTLLSVGNRR